MHCPAVHIQPYLAAGLQYLGRLTAVSLLCRQLIHFNEGILSSTYMQIATTVQWLYIDLLLTPRPSRLCI